MNHRDMLINEMIKVGAVWPDGYTHAAQDQDGGIYRFTEKPERNGNNWYVDGLDDDCEFITDLVPTSKQWYQIVITRDEWEARDGWIKWEGGVCPVDEGAMVIVRTNDGDTMLCYADRFSWDHCRGNPSRHIIAYRIVTDKLSDEVITDEIGKQPTIEEMIADLQRCEKLVQQYQNEVESIRSTIDARLVELGYKESTLVEWGDWKIGDKVRFVGYTNQLSAARFRYTPSNIYIINRDACGDIGPRDDNGLVPHDNHGYKFERV